MQNISRLHVADVGRDLEACKCSGSTCLRYAIVLARADLQII